MKARHALIVLVVALCGLSGQNSRAVGPYIPFHGVYSLNSQPSGVAPYTYVTETAGRVNLTTISEGQLADSGFMQRLVANGVWFILWFDAGSVYLNNTSGAFTTALANARTSMINSGAIARLGGVSLGEELYGCLNAVCGPPLDYNNSASYPTLAAYSGNRSAQANALRDLLAARYADVDAAFRLRPTPTSTLFT